MSWDFTSLLDITGGIPVKEATLPYIQERNRWKSDAFITDSRHAVQGKIFIAINGQVHKGITFILQALEQGSDGVIVNKSEINSLYMEIISRFPAFCIGVNDTTLAYGKLAHERSAQLKGIKIALTGSSGKTTCKEMLRSALSLHGKTFASDKNYNNHIGLPASILSAPEDCAYYIFELGMNHAGEIAHLSRILRPDISIITNVYPVHIEFFNGEEEIARAKAEVFTGQKKGGAVFLNANNMHSARIADAAKNAELKVIYFNAESLTKKKELIPSGMKNPSDLDNIALVCAVDGYFGISTEKTLSALQSFAPPEGRFSLVHSNPVIIDDAYNANPVSMKFSVQKFCKDFGIEKKICLVLGDMFELGSHSEKYHRETGVFLRELTHTLPRCTIVLAGKYMEYAHREVTSNWFPDRELALAYLISHENKADAYLFKASHGMLFQNLLKEFLCSIT